MPEDGLNASPGDQHSCTDYGRSSPEEIRGRGSGPDQETNRYFSSVQTAIIPSDGLIFFPSSTDLG